LVPLLTYLLENHASVPAIALLKRFADHGVPLVRAYCNLSLVRLGQTGPYKERLASWIQQSMRHEMIRFRPSLPWHLRLNSSPYELTPEESSRLLLEIYRTLASHHDNDGLEILLRGLRNDPKNRYALAGLLIHALQ